MLTVKMEEDQVTLQLSINELSMLNNALNEVCHGIDIPEFSTRMGATMNEAKMLLTEINDIIKNLKK